MSSISSVSSNSAWMQTQMRTRPTEAQQTKLAENAFSKIDTGKQGFFDLAGLSAAADSAASSSQNKGKTSFSSADVATVFAKLDTDSDGKVTQQEFTSTLSQLHGRHPPQDAGSAKGANSSDDQMMQKMGALSGMPPPPPPPGEAEGSEMQFDKRQSSDSTLSASASSTAEQMQQRLMSQIMKIMESYGTDNLKAAGANSNQLSLTA